MLKIKMKLAARLYATLLASACAVYDSAVLPPVVPPVQKVENPAPTEPERPKTIDELLVENRAMRRRQAREKQYGKKTQEILLHLELTEKPNYYTKIIKMSGLKIECYKFLYTHTHTIKDGKYVVFEEEFTEERWRNPRPSLTEITAYAPGEWEIRFNEIYQKAEKIKQNKKADERKEMIRRWGLEKLFPN